MYSTTWGAREGKYPDTPDSPVIISSIKANSTDYFSLLTHMVYEYSLFNNFLSSKEYDSGKISRIEFYHF